VVHPSMNRSERVRREENAVTSERDVELAGAYGPGDGGADGGGVPAAVGLGDQEQRAGLQRGHLLDERLDQHGGVLRLLPVGGHEQALVLDVAVPDAHRVVLTQHPASFS
jgi:hypothetical protein